MDLKLVTQTLLTLSPEDRAAAIQSFSLGFDQTVGLRFTSCAPERVVAELAVTSAHTQPYGLVHGGVYCTLVEAVGSCGAAMHALPQGLLPVGIENHTRFRRGARAEAHLRAVGTPHPDHPQRWEVRISDEQGICAIGQLQARFLEPGAEVGGAGVTLPDSAAPVPAAAPSRDTDGA